MKFRKKGYWILFVLTLILALLAVLTLLPYENATKESLLGYKAYCSFTPISTLVCIALAGMVCFFRKRFFVTYR